MEARPAERKRGASRVGRTSAGNSALAQAIASVEGRFGTHVLAHGAASERRAGERRIRTDSPLDGLAPGPASRSPHSRSRASRGRSGSAARPAGRRSSPSARSSTSPRSAVNRATSGCGARSWSRPDEERIMKAYLAVAVPERAPRARILAALCAMLPRVGVADDGAFVCDLRGTERLLGTPLRVARNAISVCAASGGQSLSGGLGTTPFVARIAAARAPAGTVREIPVGGERAFLDPLPLDG